MEMLRWYLAFNSAGNTGHRDMCFPGMRVVGAEATKTSPEASGVKEKERDLRDIFTDRFK